MTQFDAEPAAVRPQERLDIVQACRALGLEFPSNVTYHFDFWTHGEWPALEDDALRQAFMQHCERVAPCVAGADVIALEQPTGRSAEDVELRYQTANQRFAAGGSVRFSHKLTFQELVMQGIVRGLRRQHSRIAMFRPVDTYSDPSVARQYDEALHSSAVDDRAYLDALIAGNQLELYREVTVIKQLHDIGNSFPKPAEGVTYRVDDLHGSDHIYIPIAMRALGANVTATYIDSRAMSAKRQLERLLRFSAITIDEAAAAVPQVRAAESFGQNTWFEAMAKGNLPKPSIPVFLDVDTRDMLSMLHWRGSDRRLPLTLQQTWDTLIQNKPSGREKEARRQWLDQVLALARLACGRQITGPREL